MPAKNALKDYQEEGIYHAYNRANDRGLLFRDEQDYKVFLSFLRDKLLERNNPISNRKTFHEKISLYAFCLMPTHFHLLLKQKEEYDMSRFMKSLQLSYVFYCKGRYALRGRLLEGRYKARLIKDSADLLHVSRYIHRNPLELDKEIFSYPYSSFSFYQDSAVSPGKSFKFLDTSEVLQHFKKSGPGYKRFVNLED
ncbi:hypothetical protein GF360_04220 [candidate division WWE3 bacterium]|nr:hypothetical protein [candidate division WWE3 bacterium]